MEAETLGVGHSPRPMLVLAEALKVLVVTADPGVADVVLSVAQQNGYAVQRVEEMRSACTLLLESPSFDRVLVFAGNAFEMDVPLLQRLVHLASSEKLWIVCPLGTESLIATARQIGVRQFLHTPFSRREICELFTSSTALTADPRHSSVSAAIRKTHYCAPYLEELPDGRIFVAANRTMLDIYAMVRLLAPIDVSVLLVGETGVGKDVIASLIHKYSPRAHASFVSVNCAALPTDLIESELFGYDAGAFTGALKAKPGKFDLANRGTLLLDEIGEMSAPVQAKLLHVLQDGRFFRLGAREATQVDVRIIAATNIDVDRAIAESRFRADLFHRLGVFVISIPPLRDRCDEIPILADAIVHRQAQKLKLATLPLSPTLIEAMMSCEWRGNLRELTNFVTRFLVLRNEDAMLKELEQRAPKHGYADLPENNMHATMRDLKGKAESRLLQDALDAAGWNRRRAAAQLNISYRGLLYKIQQYHLTNSNGRLQRPSTL
jgi:two-component system response regulator AtoC